MHCPGYANALTASQKEIYTSKLLMLNNMDPYEMPFTLFEENEDHWPQIEHGDIVNYIVFSTNTVTLEQMKSYKSLEAHNYFTSGWVNRKVLSKQIPTAKVLLIGEVKHSQVLRSSPLKVWIVAENSGKIVTSHCTCMAGFGESCSHVGALLFAIQSRVKLRDSTSCTDKLNKWLPPYLKETPYLPVSKLDFSSSKKRKRNMDNILNSSDKPTSESRSIHGAANIPVRTSTELESFLKCVASTGVPAAILSVMPNFNNSFIEKCKPDDLPLLVNLFSEENCRFQWSELVEHCKKIFCSDVFCIDKSVSINVELKTKTQSKCKAWFKYRAGRITASVMKSVCHTNPQKPALSLINKICNPSSKQLRSLAITWGCTHEKIALEQYISIMQRSHEGFRVEDSGFHVNKEFSHIGASPDGLVYCHCCGEGLCEIKCPYNTRNKCIGEIPYEKNSCLSFDEAFNVELDKTHAFYYQVQTQMFVCDADYCDFVVWTEEDIHIERVFPDMLFWEGMLEKANNFYLYCVLPELTAKWFSMKK